MEQNLVEMWLRRDPVRWISGVLAGLLAGVIAMSVAGALACAFGFEAWFPVKLMGTVILGPSATETGNGMKSIYAGGAVVEGICLFFGFVYAHFTGTNRIGPLLAMGLVWGVFSWIFIWNLFLQSFRSIFVAAVPSSLAFPVCIAFGLSLASVSLFDRMLRGKH
jgi:hypothetical protein